MVCIINKTKVTSNQKNVVIVALEGGGGGGGARGGVENNRFVTKLLEISREYYQTRRFSKGPSVTVYSPVYSFKTKLLQIHLSRTVSRGNRSLLFQNLCQTSKFIDPLYGQMPPPRM